jgi:hypothetical protein
MNLLLRNKLAEIDRLVEQLQDAVRQRNEEMDSLRDEHEELRIEHWRQRKEVVTLQHGAKDISKAEDENVHLREIHEKLRGQLQGILGSIKALRADYRP